MRTGWLQGVQDKVHNHVCREQQKEFLQIPVTRKEIEGCSWVYHSDTDGL